MINDSNNIRFYCYFLQLQVLIHSEPSITSINTSSIISSTCPLDVSPVFYMKLGFSYKTKSQLYKDTMYCVSFTLMSSKQLLEKQNRMQLCNGATHHNISALQYKNKEKWKRYSLGSPLRSLVTAKSTGTTTGHRWRTTDVTHTRCPGIKLDFLFLGTPTKNHNAFIML